MILGAFDSASGSFVPDNKEVFYKRFFVCVFVLLLLFYVFLLVGVSVLFSLLRVLFFSLSRH